LTDIEESRVAVGSTVQQREDLQGMARRLRENAIPDGELLQNLGVFLTRQNLSRLLFIKHLYEQVVEIQGDIIEFGVRWGQNLAVFAVLRGILEPYNHSRRLVGFDTFEGFPEGRGG
jgi:hypothetical protein